MTASTTKPMRELMPTVAAFVDSMREAFGKDEVDTTIRNSMQGLGGHFYASENGHTIGKPLDTSRLREVSGADLFLVVKKEGKK